MAPSSCSSDGATPNPWDQSREEEERPRRAHLTPSPRTGGRDGFAVGTLSAPMVTT